MFKKKIYQHLHQDKEYVDLFSQAQKHSDNPMEQIEYVRKQNVSKKHELMFLIEMSQMYFANHPTLSEPITFEPPAIENTLRGLMEAVNHMQKDLPDGVYEFILNRMDHFLIKCLESAKNELDQRKEG
ncbi:MAG TPA: hypothetical protein VIL66_03625 [Bacillota bacterium]|jgi:hypothetical protein